MCARGGGEALRQRLDAITVDEHARTATVQAGATWHQVLEAVHPVGLSVSTMPSVDVLSVGGTVSVNAHGLDFRAGSLSSTIRSLRVMTADGQVHRVSALGTLIRSLARGGASVERMNSAKSSTSSRAVIVAVPARAPRTVHSLKPGSWK